MNKKNEWNLLILKMYQFDVQEEEMERRVEDNVLYPTEQYICCESMSDFSLFTHSLLPLLPSSIDGWSLQKEKNNSDERKKGRH